ncbi:phage tail tape measure protein [Selenomonas artemidis]|uniref:phage tail tape measure protein n=1 Tax=Selenomonas artemidis TaxID=671224 RepID=UPI0028E9BECD|nr:phage tail tape measure protein [Selenomonas artemidis]
MAAGKIFEVAFALNAVIGANFNATMMQAQNGMRTLGAGAQAANQSFAQMQTAAGTALSRLQGTEALAQRFAALKRSVTGTAADFEGAKQKAGQLAGEFNRSQAETERLRIALERAKQSAANMKATLTPATYRAMQTEIRGMADAYRESKERTKVLAAEFDAAKNRAANLKTSLGAQRQSLHEVRTALTEAGFSTQDFAGSQRKLRAEIEQTTRTQQKQAAETVKLQAAQAAKQGAQEKFSSARAGLMNAGLNVAMIAAPAIGMIETAAKFEAAMSKVQALTTNTMEEKYRSLGMTSSEVSAAMKNDFEQLTVTARKLGETTQFSATQASEAMSYLGMAGWDAQQIMAGMPGLLNLAAAGGTDLARTADIVSDDLTAFGMSAEQADHMADVFAVTVTRTNTNVEMLGDTMKYAAPVAHAFGASLEETSALAGLMANSGIKASQAGTALRTGFLRLAGPPRMAQKAMDSLGMSMQDITAEQKEAALALASLGISMEDASGQKKMSAILTELRDKTADLGREEKLAALKAIFGQEAATGWLAVLDAGTETFDNLVASLENSDGAAAEMARTMNDNARGAMIQLQSAMESVSISFGNAFLPMLASGAQMAAQYAGALSQWASEHPALIQYIGMTAAALAGMYLGVRTAQVAISGVSFAVRSASVIIQTLRIAASMAGAGMRIMAIGVRAATIAQWALNGAMLANPVGLVVAAILAVGAALYLLYDNFDTVKAFMSSLWDSAVTVFGQIGEFISGVWEGIKAGASAAWEFIVNAAKMGVTLLIAGVKAYINFWLALPGRIAYAVGFMFGFLKTAVTNGIDFLMTVPGAVWAMILAAGTAIMGLPDMIQEMLIMAGAYLMSLPDICMAAGTAFIMAATAWLSASYTTVVTWLSNLLMSAGTFLMNLPAMCAEAGAQFIAAAETWAHGAYDAVVGWVSRIPDAVSSAMSEAWEGLKGKFSAGFSAGVEVAQNARGGIYQKGAFLTTFAEDSAEAAIPLDGSPRAIGLWQRAGEILGVGREGKDAAITLPRGVFGGGSSEEEFSAPPVTIHCNFYGDTDPTKVKQAVREAGKEAQRSFAECMAEFIRESERVSYG